MTASELLKRHRYRLLRLSSMRHRLDALRSAPKRRKNDDKLEMLVAGNMPVLPA